MISIHIDHGNPMNTLLDNPFTQAMKTLWMSMKKPKKIIILSAHWLTEGEWVEIWSHPEPPMIYDMHGFPPELYEVQYGVNTDSEDMSKLSEILSKNGIQNIFNEKRGIDHGVWSVLIHLFPNAEVPIIPISVNYDANPEFHFELGKILAEHFDDNTLFISSGNIVHNLSRIDWDGSRTPQWAGEFDTKVEEIAKNRDRKKIIDYKNIPGSSISVPTPDHFYPFISFIGASEERAIESLYNGFELGSISTRIYKNF